jgi:hypothetical protein
MPTIGEGAYDWLGNTEFIPIAHALGPSLSSGINTRETLTKGIMMGFRIFEVDLAVTRDGQLVCYHGDSDKELDELTYAGYEGRLSKRGFKPLKFSELVSIGRTHTDLYFVLDVKNRHDQAYTIARREIGDMNLGRAFIPQIYFFEQLENFRRMPFFAGEIFTSYRSGLTTRQIIDTARRVGIRVVTLTMDRFRELNGTLPEGMAIFVHPVDDAFVAAEIRRLGGRGIYTSYLAPSTVTDLFEKWAGRR